MARLHLPNCSGSTEFLILPIQTIRSYRSSGRIKANAAHRLRLPLWMLGILLSALLASCSATQHLKKDQILLRKDPSFQAMKWVTVTDSSLADSLAADSSMLRKVPSKKLLLADGLHSSAIRTESNRKTLVFRSYLLLYNLGLSIQKNQFAPAEIWRLVLPRNPLPDKIASFLVNELGEAPVLVDTAQLRQDVANLKDVYFSEGFFHSKINYRIDTLGLKMVQVIQPRLDTVYFDSLRKDTFELRMVGQDTVLQQKHRKKANVTFEIEEGPAAIINRIDFETDNPLIRKIMSKNWDGSHLRSGDTYNEDNFVKERNRIVNVMRENGFYTFNAKMVSFDVDTKPDTARLTDQVPSNREITNYFPIFVTTKFNNLPDRYEIGKVTMFIEPAIKERSEIGREEEVNGNTTEKELADLGITLRNFDPAKTKMAFKGLPRTLSALNLNFLEKHMELQTGQKYSLSDERTTQQRLQNLGVFKYVLIKHVPDHENRKVNVIVQAVLLQKYQIKGGAEGFWETDPLVQTNFPGFGLEIGFRDQMLFKGAEQLDLSAKGNMSFFRLAANQPITPFLEGSGQAELQFPRILFPFLGEENFQRFEPRTSLVSTFSRQQNNLYQRNNLTLDFNYSFFHSSRHKRAQSKISPLVVTLVDSDLSEDFVRNIIGIEDDGLRRLIIQDYRPRFSTYSQYEFTYTNYMSTRKEATYFIQPKIEIGGNIPYLIDTLFNIDATAKDRKLDNIFYGQYYKASLEIKNYLPLGDRMEFVMRNFFGVAIPWNFTGTVPLESRFFAGGANTMRGWQSNTLGPGTYVPSFDPNVANPLNRIILPGGEVSIEANYELRANVNSYTELAIFSDVGNVWFLPGHQAQLQGAQISKETILQLGWDIGLGVRFDFDFLIFRLDMAQQLYAPDRQDFVVKSFPRDLGASRFQYNFGIGYPF